MKKNKLLLSVSVIICLILSVSGINVFAEETQTLSIPQTGFIIRNIVSKKYLTVKNAESRDGAEICQFSANGMSDFNMWYTVRTEKGIALENLTGGTKRYLNADSAANNAVISSEPLWFSLLQVSENEYVLNSEYGCLSVNAKKDGAEIFFAEYLDSGFQKWQFESIEDIMPGDSSFDGVINVFDAVLMRRTLSDDIYADPVRRAVCNVDGNDKCDSADVQEMYDFLTAKSDFFTSDNSTICPSDIQPIVPETSKLETPIELFSPTMKSKGTVRIPVILIQSENIVDNDVFTDKYGNDMDDNEVISTVKEYIFSAEDTSSQDYPFESVSAFYKRASYDQLNIEGDVYMVTIPFEDSRYLENREDYINESLRMLDDEVDFTVYDGDNDGIIDAPFFLVPYSMGSSWHEGITYYRCDDEIIKPDGMTFSTLVNMKLSFASRRRTVQTFCHETGHVMQLPDYYKYNAGLDKDAFSGIAGIEILDANDYGDFCAFSKIMENWVDESKIHVYDPNQGEQKFSIESLAKSGECIIIPRGTLDKNYYSEYFIIEYVSEEGNCTDINSGGVRIFHVQADTMYSVVKDKYYFCFDGFAPDYDKSHESERILRLVNDGNGFFTESSIVDHNTPGFAWYDENGKETVNSGLKVEVGSLNNGKYDVTVSAQ